MSASSRLSSSTAYQSGGNGTHTAYTAPDGFRPNEVKKFQSGSGDTLSRLQSTVFAQPDFYVALASLGLLAVIQTGPNHFLPQNLLGRRFHGIGAQRYFAIPFAMISSSYIAVGDQLADKRYMGAHTAGLLLSTFTFFSFSCMHRLAPIFPGLGVPYAIYGIAYHYRSLGTFYDGSPFVTWGDLSEVCYDALWGGESRKVAMRRLEREEEEKRALMELHRKSRE